MDNPTNTPNPTPAPSGGNEPAGGAEPSAEPTKPIMGTTPGGSRAKQEPATPAAPTTEPEGGEGTEGGQEPPATPQNPAEPEIDYEKKFSESSKEAQRLLQVLKEAGIDPKTGQPIEAPSTEPSAQQTRVQAPGVDLGLPEPAPQPTLTDEQLSKAIPGFANMSEAEKTMLRDTKAFTKGYQKMVDLVTEMYDEREFGKQLTSLTAKDEFKAIAEHKDDFKAFAYEEGNLKVPLETLAASFLYTKGLGAKPQTPETPPKPPTEGLEPSSGGGVEGRGKTQEGYTTEELAQIRTKDPKRYAKLAREGKLRLRE